MITELQYGRVELVRDGEDSETSLSSKRKRRNHLLNRSVDIGFNFSNRNSNGDLRKQIEL